MAKVLTVENLTMKFDEQTVFENLNFALKKGSMTALLGPNGAGKTTLIRILMNMLTATAGVFKFSQDTKIGYVPQFRNIDSDYPLSIRAFIELNTPLFKSTSIKKRVDNILKETNLLEIQNTRMGEASGGQKQRAYLAQALLDEPNFIILDEATASLDPVAKEELMTLIKHLNEKHGLTVLFTTHDIPLAKKYMKDYLLFKDKNLEHNKISQLTKEAYE
ncbi:metal ABC transporter ATP-binding protein [Lactobacillus mulieris]|uniref:ATP-binding cassette domain-containing protein n=1 Tax=Lactobacillus mulieris TaxID=2508708 RepID=A0AAW5WXD1_9LACO|nr:ATP-binding cassette domain-containing protein [Lactobacillus mulieris]MCZ3621789.1 ATP-binding cassette domain-containing protein [Lactobacillus mulieris]MCZ3623486.1 ATP-binding cassette domain-containing protein [Lactobacillus mulieris]MCZ3635796.1 ATP-binding cassette domain-containing protein [Lactobacillus mulieris]MCZ3689584.1 ATP-binding cassette domain-containing protein [Lactobacillus mulieris]MCZ3695587.1 ATP-binding cassette domain-containing protein [Lactobacillus mulieris]